MNTITALELKLPTSLYEAFKAMAEHQHLSEDELAIHAIRAYLTKLKPSNAFFGLFADEPELVDQVLTQALLDRETTPLRLEEPD